uniref:Uncharacterized protein n=1 Tax=Mycena chlorophos TaxID=658473 RepID=A0ABQ0L0N4_MYCCL|nr:predicted protein [Mycena chlorophos]
MSDVEFIQHLDVEHGYPLVCCSEEHDHDPSICSTLPPNPQFHEDARYRADVYLGTAVQPLSSRTFRDYRHNSVRDASQQKILLAAQETTSGTTIRAFELKPIPESRAHKYRPSPIKRTSRIRLDPPGYWRVQRCLADIFHDSLIFGLHTTCAILEACPKPSLLARCPRPLLEVAGLVKSHDDMLSFIANVQGWRHTDDLTQCLEYLATVFLDIQFNGIAESLYKDGIRLEHIADMDVDEIGPYGLELDSEGWAAVVEEVAGWIKTCSSYPFLCTPRCLLPTSNMSGPPNQPSHLGSCDGSWAGGSNWPRAGESGDGVDGQPVRAPKGRAASVYAQPGRRTGRVPSRGLDGSGRLTSYPTW